MPGNVFDFPGRTYMRYLTSGEKTQNVSLGQAFFGQPDARNT
jgi:hypothetical protein